MEDSVESQQTKSNFTPLPHRHTSHASSSRRVQGGKKDYIQYGSNPTPQIPVLQKTQYFCLGTKTKARTLLSQTQARDYLWREEGAWAENSGSQGCHGD